MIENESKQALIVLGMHRSGTSVLSGLLSLAGFDPPRDLMPPTADNPQGYWESRSIAQVNNQLLIAASTRWNDDSHIPIQWLTSSDRDGDIKAIHNTIDDQFGQSTRLLVKDPRLCRLLPLWKKALSEAGITQRCVLILRDPNAVARSLAARATSRDFSPAAICSHSRAALLWLKYTLDAERHSRDIERFILDYDCLVRDWKSCIEPLLESGCIGPLNNNIVSSIDGFIKSDFPHHLNNSCESSYPKEVVEMLASVMQLIARASHDNSEKLDFLNSRLGQFTEHYKELRINHDYLSHEDYWSDQILHELARDFACYHSPRTEKKTAVFISASPQSIGHIYRVENIALALEATGWETLICSMNDDIPEDLTKADIAVVFRAVANDQFKILQSACDSLGIPLVYNIDDLLFDPRVASMGQIAYLDCLPKAERQIWLIDSYRYRDALQICDAAIMSTEPLGRRAIQMSKTSYIIPNILNTRIESVAASMLNAPKISASDGIQRLVFASGTPTHDRDFRIAAEGIALAMKRLANIRLIVIGHINISLYPSLLPYVSRIDIKPVIPYYELPIEISKYDLNLCPLEPSNDFCECKSAVRCLIASIVSVPTIASKSQPLQEMIGHEKTGIIISHESPNAWATALTDLLLDSNRRLSLAYACRIDALARYGFQTWVARISMLLESLTTIPD